MELKEVPERLYIGNAPGEVVRRSQRCREEYIRALRDALLRETAEAKFKYYCSLCLITRDENEYLEEWLRWHIGAGCRALLHLRPRQQAARARTGGGAGRRDSGKGDGDRLVGQP